MGACSATSAAAVGAISRTTYHPLGESSGHWRLSTKTADLEFKGSQRTCPMCWQSLLSNIFVELRVHDLESTSDPIMSLYNFQKMLTLLRRTPALLPRASARLLASESAKAQQDAEVQSPSPAPPQQNPLDTRDYFGTYLFRDH